MSIGQLLALAASIDFAAQRRSAAARYGSETSIAIDAWETLTLRLTNASIETQLLEVNGFFNSRARWTTDEDLYGQADYWATPLELLAVRAGDCEDYAIAKYLTLLSIGVAAESLRLVYVRATLQSGVTQPHMVLTWYRSPGAEPLILDNLNTEVLPAGQRSDLSPVFSFSASELWVGTNQQASKARPRERMSRWRNLLDRAAAEGFNADS